MEESDTSWGTAKAPAICDRANSAIWQTRTQYTNQMFDLMSLTLDITLPSSAFVVVSLLKFNNQSSFCYKMKTQAVFQAGIANLLDVSGSVGCVPRCLSLLTHHLCSCLLEALQGLLLIWSQVLLQFKMSLDKNKHEDHTQTNKSNHIWEFKKMRKQTLKQSSTNAHIVGK